MAARKTKKQENRPRTNLVEVPITQVSRGDVIYISGDDDQWLVIDLGQPYILIENLRTHFGSLYHVVSNVYKERSYAKSK